MADEVLKLAEDLVAGYLASSEATRTAAVLSSISGGIVSTLDDARKSMPEPPRVRVMAAPGEFPHAELAKVPVMVRLEIATSETGETDLGTDPGTAAGWFHKIKLDLRDLSQWDTYLRDQAGANWGLRKLTPVTLSTEADPDAGDGEQLRMRMTTGLLLTFLGAATGAPSGDPLSPYNSEWMRKSVYDPDAVESDAFDLGNHDGTLDDATTTIDGGLL